MGIYIDQKNKRAHLFTQNTSYVIETLEGELLHSYWGKRIELPNYSPLVAIEEGPSFYPNPNLMNKTYSLDIIPREYPDFGRSDYRSPGYRVKLEDGTKITKCHVVSFSQFDGKPEIPGLPSIYVEKNDEVSTLQIELKDEKTGMIIYLYYCVNETYNALTRYTRFENKGSQKLVLDGALSGSVDFYHDCDFDLVHLNGSWTRERHVERLPIGRSKHVIESKRGASGHHENPMVMLARPKTDDFSGEVYSMNLVYSGSFKSIVEVNSYDATRFQMGINDFDFEWNLGPGEVFDTPEVVLVYSDQGFNGMSQIYHKLYRERLCRGSFRDKERPILINNWEATYFSFTQEKLEAIGRIAGEIGIELFVLDDGWFGKRDSDKSGLGDWFVNKEKLSKGLGGVSEYMKEQNLDFGLWFEPEMVSPDSDLFRAHPEWCLQAKGHTLTEGRNQLVLDFSRKDVQDYIIEVVGDILGAYPITYVKWDMNRNMTETYSELLKPEAQGETTHRYILGLYRVLEVLTSRFDEILFESCSGGGGRFDPGMLYYMPQTWTSDDTDAYERLFIQYGTSFSYPTITMGAHVSVSPNHQTGRETPLHSRGFAAMMANLGYELDLSALNSEELSEVKQQVDFYKAIRKDIQFGQFYRLLSPFEHNESAFLVESPDQKSYYLFFFTGLNRPNRGVFTLPLHYLSEGEYKVTVGDYRLTEGDNPREQVLDNDSSEDKDQIYPSSFLNRFGYTLKRPSKDYEGQLIIFTKHSSRTD